MSKKDFDEVSYDKPSRKFDKKKQSKRGGANEDTKASRQARIGFKNYLREIEEEELEDSMDDFDDE